MNLLRMTLLTCFGLLALACRSPLAQLPPGPGGPALQLSRVTVADHSRQLKRLRATSPQEGNTPEARRQALEGHARWLETAFREEAAACGVAFPAQAPYRLDLEVTDLGEVQTRYIVYGIASGVAWGVATGLLAHNPRLALGLGGYELVEESAFWIAGSSLFSSFSAPAVVEARLFRKGETRPLWSETYFALSGRAWTRDLPEAQRGDRGIQLRASLQKVILKILADLEAIPGFPAATRSLLAEPELRRRITSGIDPAGSVPGAETAGKDGSALSRR